MRAKPSSPWWAIERDRLLFEGGARSAFPTLVRSAKHGAIFGYEVDIEVPYYESRRVSVLFYSHRSRNAPMVLADGPTDSPHRHSLHGRRQLCIWHPEAVRAERWVWEDGLLTLLGLTRMHLFREAYWREFGEWTGPEAAHGDPEEAA